MKSKNKVVIKDDFGNRWFVTKEGKFWPVNWKMFCALESAKAHKEAVQEKLYGKKGK